MMRTLGSVELERLVAESGLGEASVVLEELDPAGSVLWTATLRPAAAIYPASMIKLPIAMVLAARCAAGVLGWRDTVAIDAANLTTNDSPSPFVAGYVAELRELAHAMLAASDNVATNVLIDVLDRSTMAPACAAFGLTATVVARKLSGSLPLIDDPIAVGRNAHPAADAATLLRIVAREPARQPAIVWDALVAQIWNDKLAAGLEPGDHFAHKTGDTDEVSHDGGILTLAGGRRFVLVVYSQLPSKAETDACFAEFMRALRPLLHRSQQDRIVAPR